MLGKGSTFSEMCRKENFIGADFGLKEDLKSNLSEDWKEFNKKFIPIYLKEYPEKTKVAGGLACGALWTISKGLNIGDVVLSPKGDGNYLVGEVSGDYYYVPNQALPHRRNIKWYSEELPRTNMSQPLKNSTGSIGTTCDVSKHSEEIESLIKGKAPFSIVAVDSSIENVTEFAMEKHLEDFLVKNWSQTELGKKYDLFFEDGEVIGQQYPADKDRIDILAVSKDGKELLVIELKKGRASDYVVGQILRYMGFIKEEIAEKHQIVKGVIIALEDDIKIRRALSVTQNIDFYRYQINFSLKKT